MNEENAHTSLTRDRSRLDRSVKLHTNAVRQDDIAKTCTNEWWSCSVMQQYKLIDSSASAALNAAAAVACLCSHRTPTSATGLIATLSTSSYGQVCTVQFNTLLSNNLLLTECLRKLNFLERRQICRYNNQWTTKFSRLLSYPLDSELNKN